MPQESKQPRITNLDRDQLIPYDLEGPEQTALIRWLPITYDRVTQKGSYFFDMLPGAWTTPHTHPHHEEFMILEGEAIESDGRVLKAGDFISYPPGSHHNTRTETGCLAIVVEWTDT